MHQTSITFTAHIIRITITCIYIIWIINIINKASRRYTKIMVGEAAHKFTPTWGVSIGTREHIFVGTFYLTFNSARESPPLPLDKRRMKIVIYAIN